MHKKYLVLISILITAALVVVPATFAQGEEGFTETFDDPSLPGWEKSREAIVTEGALHMTPGSFALHIGDWTEITLTVKVKYSGEGVTVVNYYFRDEGKYGLFLNTGRVRLEKEQQQSPALLGETDVSAIRPDVWLNIKVVVSGGEHQIYVNDELTLTATDPQPLKTGAILLQVMGEMTTQFDDLNVRGTPSGGPPPDEQPREPVEEPAASPADLQPAAPPAAPAAAQTQGDGNFLNEFFASQASTIELTTFLINLILAAVCAYILGVVYIHWGASLTNRRKFASNFLLMTVTTTFIIMVVRSSVALSLGLVGALSIVRFRAAVKEPEELAYLFFALGIGIGLGDNQRLITLTAMAIGIALIGLRQISLKTEADVNLHVSIANRNPSEVSLEQITETLGRHTAKLKLLRFDETAEVLEAAYLIEFRRMDQLNEARAALRAMSPSLEITFMDNKGIW